MRIVLLTAGTGSFHCGTCMRDNALVLALRKLGHDALMAPLYLPPVLDEPSAAEGVPLFYGGINVYLQQKSALFRHAPRWVDSLLDAPVMLKAAAKRAGMTRASELGELTLSTLRGEEGNQAKELDRLLEWLTCEGKPDLVCISNALLIGLARRIKQETGAAVVCTLQGEDTYLDALSEPFRTQAWELLGQRAQEVDGFIAVSRYHGELMTRRAGLPAERVRIVHNGISLEGYPDEPAPMPAPPALGYLARMYAPKGLGALVDAFILLDERETAPNLRLLIGGSCTDADKQYVTDLELKLDMAGLQDRYEFRPNLERAEKVAFLRELSIFSVPATYGESFGLYVLEAMAAGVPVVQPRHAAFPEIVEATGCGILVEPNDVSALADGIEQLLNDQGGARELGEAGRLAVRRGFGVERMAAESMEAFELAVERSKSGVGTHDGA